MSIFRIWILLININIIEDLFAFDTVENTRLLLFVLEKKDRSSDNHNRRVEVLEFLSALNEF